MVAHNVVFVRLDFWWRLRHSSTKTIIPTEQEIACAIEGNLCRCTGYQQIIDSIKAAAEIHRGEKESQPPVSDAHPDPHPAGPDEPTMPPGHAR